MDSSLQHQSALLPQTQDFSPGRGTLTKSQITNQTHLKLLHQLYLEIPSAFSNPSLPISLCICFWLLSQGTELQSRGCAQHSGTGLPAQGLALYSSATHPLVASGKSLSFCPAASCLPAEFQTPLGRDPRLSHAKGLELLWTGSTTCYIP